MNYNVLLVNKGKEWRAFCKAVSVKKATAFIEGYTGKGKAILISICPTCDAYSYKSPQAEKDMFSLNSKG